MTCMFVINTQTIFLFQFVHMRLKRISELSQTLLALPPSLQLLLSGCVLPAVSGTFLHSLSFLSGLHVAWTTSCESGVLDSMFVLSSSV